jgi:diguanylate cyclase (GGDEF)-like protein
VQNAHLFQEVERLSATDPLTGLHNRRHFSEAARAEFSRSVRFDLSLSVLMLDLDHFKLVNDTHAHAAGDDVLTQVAAACRGQLRAMDIHARYGGEEFCFVLPETDLEGAVLVAMRLREAIAALRFAGADGTFIVTASLGVAERDGPDDTLEELLGRSDNALYEAKRAGRDRVAVR